MSTTTKPRRYTLHHQYGETTVAAYIGDTQAPTGDQPATVAGYRTDRDRPGDASRACRILNNEKPGTPDDWLNILAHAPSDAYLAVLTRAKEIDRTLPNRIDASARARAEELAAIAAAAVMAEYAPSRGSKEAYIARQRRNARKALGYAYP